MSLPEVKYAGAGAAIPDPVFPFVPSFSPASEFEADLPFSVGVGDSLPPLDDVLEASSP